jgi:hypothetical protein
MVLYKMTSRDPVYQKMYVKLNSLNTMPLDYSVCARRENSVVVAVAYSKLLLK